jgi:uncharacterized YccA/Bax inhibitor family protein
MKAVLYGLGVFMMLLAFSLSGNIETADELLKLVCLTFSGIISVLLGFICYQNEQISGMEKSIREFWESEKV